MMEKKRMDPTIRLFGVIVASLVLAALPVAVTSNPVSEYYNPQQSSGYESYYPQQPVYEQNYAAPTYDSYQAPVYEQNYETSYTPSYQKPYEPAYTPTYEKPAYEAYQKPYEPVYTPSYEKPAYEAYQKPYESYMPTYEKPAYEAYQKPYESYMPTYEKPAYEAYPAPTYEKPSYEAYPSPAPTYEKPSYEAYQKPYEPAYKPSYEKPSYESYQKPYEAYPKPSYGYEKPSYEAYPKPTYEKPSYKVEYYPEYVNYEAITYREMNESIHCGVIPAVNSELYKNSYGGYQYQPEYGYGKGSNNLALTTATLPFGKFPWTVLITDEYNTILCEGTIVNYRYILTLSSCVEPYAHQKLRIRFGDWDILNNANEYEVYKNVEAKICRKFPVTCSSYGYGYQQQKQESLSGLTLLKAEFEPDYDAYPQVRSVCLPEHYPSYQPEYKAPYQPQPPPSYGYQQQPAPSYGYQQPAAPSYAPAPYTPPPTYYKPTYAYYSECYVAGYYGSPTTKLENHKRPTPYEGYGYQQAYYPQTSAYSSYSYESYESKIPKIAKVKQIKCENYNGYQKPQGYGKESCEENMCFVGVHGDACVADYGSAIVCMVPEKESYDSGYSNDYTESYGYSNPTYQPPPTYSTYGNAPNSYYKKEIKAAPAQDKVERKRAAIVAVVEYPTQCTSSYKPQQYGYGYQAQEQQSKPIVAIKVTEKVVDFILEKFFEGVKEYC